MQIPQQPSHNRFNTLTLPMEIGYVISNRKFQYGFNVALSLNFLKEQTGRTLDSLGGVTSFEMDYDLAPFSNNFLAFRVKPSIGYAFLRTGIYTWQASINIRNSQIIRNPRLKPNRSSFISI